MTRTNYLLSMAGVNIAEFIDDTSDLSTMRGGGLLLLDAVARVEDHLKSVMTGAITISRGASEGLFLLPSSVEPDEVRKNVTRLLDEDPVLKHATFVVDVEPMNGDEDFVRAKKMVNTRNRWRQMQAPSLAIPGTPGKTPCTTDGVRPASKSGASISVSSRREFGRKEKQGIYAKLTRLEALPRFAQDFGEIASDGGRGNLHNKLAIIYLDGNGFNSLQQQAKTPDALKQFDEDLRGKREGFLRQLFTEISGNSAWMNGKVFRFETLLWGGDELMFVVPAWQGWWLLQRFFEKSSTWATGNGNPLHHAAGLVFCHHNAPIARIRDLAHDVADHVKDLLGDKKMKESGLAYLALESFDSLGTGLESYLAHTLLPMGENLHRHWWLPAEAMSVWTAQAPRIIGELPKRRIYRAARAVTQTGAYDEIALLEGLDGFVADAWLQLKQSLPESGRMPLPLHLALLWDYLDNAELTREPPCLN